MRFELKINMDNAAFDDSQEIPRILRSLADIISRYPEAEARKVYDVNGKVVGISRYVGRKE